MNNNETSRELRTVNGGALVSAALKDTLTELMDIAAARAGDVLQMAYRINLHLFGIEDHEPDDKTAPTCFRDVLCAETSYYDWCCEYCGQELIKCRHNGWCRFFAPAMDREDGGINE